MNLKDKIIYIAGPMRGMPDLNVFSFQMAEHMLRAKGARVLNPAILPTDLPQESYMPICLAMLGQAEAIALLPGYNKSQGANLELSFAWMTGKETIKISEDFKILGE